MYNYNRENRELGFIELKLNRCDLIVSKTNLKGEITYANPSFVHISGYTTAELVGSNHNLLRHPDMPRTVFKHIWQRLEKSEPTYCYIKNLTKDGSYYWVFAYIVPDFDAKGDIIGFHSERRAPNPKAIDDITNLYQRIKRLEISDGVDVALETLKSIATSKADSCEDFIFNLQNQE